MLWRAARDRLGMLARMLGSAILPPRYAWPLLNFRSEAGRTFQRRRNSLLIMICAGGFCGNLGINRAGLSATISTRAASNSCSRLLATAQWRSAGCTSIRPKKPRFVIWRSIRNGIGQVLGSRILQGLETEARKRGAQTVDSEFAR